MADESENLSGEDMAKDEASESLESASTSGKGVLSAQKLNEQSFQSGVLEAAMKAQKRQKQILQSDVLETALKAQERQKQILQSDVLETALKAQERQKQILQSDVLEAALKAQKRQKQMLQSEIVQSLIDLQSSFDVALTQLNSPSVTADIATISEAQYSKSRGASSQKSEVDEYLQTDVDQIRPPETRIHDQLIWDDGKWYRDRTRELSIHLVDYIFWKAKEGSELTDATDREISIATTAAAFILTLALTWNPVYIATVSGATGKITETSIKAAKSRNERKDLDGKFNSGDE